MMHGHRPAILRALLLCTHGVAGLALAMTVQASGELERILSAHAPEGPDTVIRGEFKQEKYLAELDEPLVSRGEFVVAPGDGLIWRVRQPVTSTMVVTRRHLVETVEGRETLRVTSEERPALRMMATAMLAVFRADADRLKEFFEVDVEAADGDDWALRLRPRGETAAEFMDFMQLCGGTRVELVEVAESGGDRTVIHLVSASSTSGGLTADERAELGQ